MAFATLPDGMWLQSPNEAGRYLYRCLVEDEAYDLSVLETAVFTVEWLDGMPDCALRDYTDIAMRGPAGPGIVYDSGALPLIDRFRVYSDGRILYSSQLMGFLAPYEDFLRGRIDI